MMRYKIHYTINGVDDYYILSGDTLKEIQKKNETQMEWRGLDSEKNNCWSEEIKK